MKTYYIKIKRGSVKENPNHSQGSLQHIHTGTSVDIQSRGEGRPPEKIGNFFMVSASGSVDGLFDSFYKGFEAVGADEARSLFKKHGLEIIAISVDFQHQQIQSALTPSRYLYDYQNKKVQCRHCKSTFDHTRLEDEYIELGPYDVAHLDSICPVCKEEECCKIEYEQFDEEKHAV